MTNKNQSKAEEQKDSQVDSEDVSTESPASDSQEQTPAEEPLTIEAQLEQAKEESRKNHERYLRAVADWENYRRRMTREKEELRKHVTASLIEEFLPVLDNLALGLQTAANHPEAKNVAQGFAMVGDQIRAIFEQNGVSEIDPLGEPFDPHQHEAMAHQPDDTVAEGHVMQV
ncbi:MAG TPA: nucleotide exchange factor GrpE, partial [Opitutales bacterium]|nr:nucleotide exchange factor GrpE [Opitutales bacterium]